MSGKSSKEKCKNCERLTKTITVHKNLAQQVGAIENHLIRHAAQVTKLSDALLQVAEVLAGEVPKEEEAPKSEPERST